MTNCSREITSAIDAIVEVLRVKPRFDEAELGNLRLQARSNFHSHVLARAVLERANGGRARPTPPTQSPPTPPATAARSSGTGFVVTEQGHVLTNAHVIKGCAEPKAFTSNGSVFAGRVLAKDERNDLAVLTTALRPTVVARFRTAVKLGESVAVFGYPHTGLLSSSGNFSIGNVTATTGIADDISKLQISAQVQPGNSGGPLLDETGNVVGVVVAKLDARKVARKTFLRTSTSPFVPPSPPHFLKRTTLISRRGNAVRRSLRPKLPRRRRKCPSVSNARTLAILPRCDRCTSEAHRPHTARPSRFALTPNKECTSVFG